MYSTMNLHCSLYTGAWLSILVQHKVPKRSVALHVQAPGWFKDWWPWNNRRRLKQHYHHHLFRWVHCFLILLKCCVSFVMSQLGKVDIVTVDMADFERRGKREAASRKLVIDWHGLVMSSESIGSMASCFIQSFQEMSNSSYVLISGLLWRQTVIYNFATGNQTAKASGNPHF